MADRWMDERDRDWRDRDWRGSERTGRSYGRDDDARRWREERSWASGSDEEGGSYEDPGRRRTYGEDDEGREDRRRADLTSGGRTYGAGGAYGSGARYGRSGGGSGGAPRFTPQDYTGCSYEAGCGDYVASSRQAYGGQQDWRREEGYGERRQDWDVQRRYDQGYRGRGYEEPGERERWEERRGRGEGGGDFLQRAGERISAWFRGDRDERRDEGPRRYSADFGREARWSVPDRDHRGVGPKGYKRSDERISEEVHERLTEDPWVDASNVHVEVKGGEVTLSGQVDNRESKHRAERLIEDISGVGHVQNNLRVNPSTLTGAGRGYGSSALEAEMRRNAEAGDGGAGAPAAQAGKGTAGGQSGATRR